MQLVWCDEPILDLRQRPVQLVDQPIAGICARKPGLAGLLKMMRGPAQLAGLGELQSFLERGFTAFRSMDSARVFLDTIIERERALSRQLFGGGQSLELPPA